MKIQSYRDLEVWRRAMSLVEEIYIITLELPDSERYGLASQIQRASVSIPSNIAEGYYRRSTAEYLRFLSMAYGSAGELDTQLIIIDRQYNHIHTDRAKELLTEVQKMLYSIMDKLTVKN